MRETFRTLLPLAALVGITACAESGTQPSRARLVIDPRALSLYEGRVDTATATVFDADVLAAAPPVVWRSDNPAVAAVDSQGVVNGRAPGRTSLTAASGMLTASVDVTVLADSVKPQIGSISLSSPTIDLIGGEAVISVLVRVRDTESGVHYVDVNASPTAEGTPWDVRQYCAPALESGTAADGSWRCALPLHRYSAPGEWRLRVTAYDWRPFPVNFDSSSTTFVVANASPDDTPPLLTELAFTQERTNLPGEGESRIMLIGATDDESGMLTAEFFLDSDTTPGIYGCGTERPRPHPFPWIPIRAITGRCAVSLVASDTPVMRTISLVRLSDARGNVRRLTTADLARGGFPTRIDIRK